MRAAHNARRRVPQQLAVVGIDDTQFARVFSPSLTSVSARRRDGGATRRPGCSSNGWMAPHQHRPAPSYVEPRSRWCASPALRSRRRSRHRDRPGRRRRLGEHGCRRPDRSPAQTRRDTARAELAPRGPGGKGANQAVGRGPGGRRGDRVPRGGRRGRRRAALWAALAERGPTSSEDRRNRDPQGRRAHHGGRPTARTRSSSPPERTPRRPTGASTAVVGTADVVLAQLKIPLGVVLGSGASRLPKGRSFASTPHRPEPLAPEVMWAALRPPRRQRARGARPPPDPRASTPRLPRPGGQGARGRRDARGAEALAACGATGGPPGRGPARQRRRHRRRGRHVLRRLRGRARRGPGSQPVRRAAPQPRSRAARRRPGLGPDRGGRRGPPAPGGGAHGWRLRPARASTARRGPLVPLGPDADLRVLDDARSSPRPTTRHDWPRWRGQLAGWRTGARERHGGHDARYDARTRRGRAGATVARSGSGTSCSTTGRAAVHAGSVPRRRAGAVRRASTASCCGTRTP